MAIRKLLFKNKPKLNSFGIYSFDDGNDSNLYSESNSSPINPDKFRGKDLYTTSIGDAVNEAILDSKVQEKYAGLDDENIPIVSQMKYLGESYFRINSMNIVNRGVRSDINDVYFRIYIFTKEFFNPFKSGGRIKSYTELKDTTNDNAALFWTQNGPNYNAGGAPGNLLKNLTILQNFDTINNHNFDTGVSVDPQVGIDYPRKHTDFNPLVSMPKVGGISLSDNTTIFQEDNTDNPIYIAILMDGDQDTFFDRSRNETIDIWEINPNDLFDERADGTKEGKITTLDFKSHTAERFSKNQSRTAAFSGRELSLTINTLGGVSLAEGYPGSDNENPGTYRPPMEYANIVDRVIPPYQSKNDYDSLILNIFPERQIQNDINSNTFGDYDEDTDYYTGKFANYIPVSQVQMQSTEDKLFDFQHYYENPDDRIITSSPATVNLDFFIAFHPEPLGDLENRIHGDVTDSYRPFTLDGYDPNSPSSVGYELYNRYTYEPYGEDFSPNNTEEYPYGNITYPGNYGMFLNPKKTYDVDYMFFVIDWNDEDDEFKTIDDVMLQWPRNEIQLIEKRDENLYIPKIIDRKNFSKKEVSETIQFGEEVFSEPLSDINKHMLKHSYSTPGIKTIKTIMFSYDFRDVYKLEPLRWKLITTKIFLDIPTSEYPDFSEVGGSDYTTIPWPHTTPIIGGVSKDSKYVKSIEDTLASGNFGNSDIIDEVFLVSAKENNQLGENIEKMDLEQVRFFNTGSYSMNTLLKIPTVPVQVVDDTVETISELPFPFWREEFDLNEDNNVNPQDAEAWNNVYRPDIAEWILLEPPAPPINEQGIEIELDEIEYSWDVHNMDLVQNPNDDYGEAHTEIWNNVDKAHGYNAEIEDFNYGEQLYVFDEDETVYQSFISVPPPYISEQALDEESEDSIYGLQFSNSDETHIHPNSFETLQQDVEHGFQFTYGIGGNNQGFNQWIMIPLIDIKLTQSFLEDYGAFGVENEGWAYGADNSFTEPFLNDIYPSYFPDITYPGLEDLDGLFNENNSMVKNPFQSNNGFMTFINQDIDDDFRLFDSYEKFFPHSSNGFTNTYNVNEPGNLVGLYIEIKKDGDVFGELMQVERHSVDPFLGYARIKLTRGMHQEAGFHPVRNHDAGDLVYFYSNVVINESFNPIYVNDPTYVPDQDPRDPWIEEEVESNEETPSEETGNPLNSTYVLPNNTYYPPPSYFETIQNNQNPPESLITDGCQLPAEFGENLYWISNGDVLYNIIGVESIGDESAAYIASFTITFYDDITINNISGGQVETNGFTITQDGNTIYGYSLTNGEITGCGTLFNVDYTMEGQSNPPQYDEPYVEDTGFNFEFIDQNGEEMDLNFYSYNDGCNDPLALNYNNGLNSSGDQITLVNNAMYCEYKELEPLSTFNNTEVFDYPYYENPYNNLGVDGYWNGSTPARTFSEETSVGQIFITDNEDSDLVSKCTIELNTGNLSRKSIRDSAGNLNKGLLIGDYKITKTEKNSPMRRDSFIKVAKKESSNNEGAL